MRTKRNTVDLEDFRIPGTKVFTGREMGRTVRERSKIDEMAKEFDEVYLIVPKDIFSINPSFLEELLINSVKGLGKEKFWSKFKIVNEGTFPAEVAFNEAIDRILRKMTALG
jgi:hypothetical protein